VKRTVAALALAAGAGGCAMPPIDEAAPLPYIAILRPPPEGQEDILLTAGLRSRIHIDSECVLLGDTRRVLVLPIFYRGTKVGRDARGLYVQDPHNGIRFRDGESVRGGGGQSPFTGRELDAILQQPVPQVCLGRTNGTAGSVNPGLRRD